MEVEIFWEVNAGISKSENLMFSSVIMKLAALSREKSFFDYDKYSGKMKLNIIIIDDTQIQEINRNYRNKNVATDVLTFPFDKELLSKMEVNCAEIYISQDTARKQCKSQSLALLDELIILTVHGFLHAFGYDHEVSSKAAKEMRDHEREILNYLGFESATPLTK